MYFKSLLSSVHNYHFLINIINLTKFIIIDDILSILFLVIFQSNILYTIEFI